MNDEELIQKLSKTWSIDSWDQVLSYKQLFKDINNYYKYLAKNSNRYNLQEIWEFIKDDWRLIQNNLNELRSNNCIYKICPYCGEISGKFGKHILTHNISILDYILLYNNLTELPKCLVCGNTVNYDPAHCIIYETCSRSCATSLRVNNKIKLGTHHWLHNNQNYDENGKSIRHIKIDKVRLDKGNFHFSHHNLEFNKDGKSIYHLKSIESKRINRTHNWAYNGNPEHDEEIFKFHQDLGRKAMNTLHDYKSYPENLLGDILFHLNINYIREYLVLNGCYRIDYYLPDYNIGLECDGEYKYDDSKFNISDSMSDLSEYYFNRNHKIMQDTGIVIKHIWSQEIINFYWYNKRKLYEFLIHIDYPLIHIK